MTDSGLIDRVETLDAMGVGAVIAVSTPDLRTKSEWTRTPEGWASGTAVIESNMLYGCVRAGLVVDAAKQVPQVGEWFHGRTHELLILAVTEGVAECLTVHRSSGSVSQTSVPFERLRDRFTRQAEMPDLMLTPTVVSALVQAHVDLIREHKVTLTKVETLRRRPDPASLREQARAARALVDSLLESLGE